MPELLIYLLKANLAITLFYVGYRLLLHKLTFYNLNRFYLLFALVFSFVYPLPGAAEWFQRSERGLPDELVYIIPDWQRIPADNLSWSSWIIGLIGLGAAWFTVRFFMRLLSLWGVHRRSAPAMWQWFSYRQVSGNIPPFSFWRNIYVNVHNHEEGELQEIFKHEKIHVDGLHTFDMLLVELCCTVSWFNPAMWLLRYAVRENLEFITDRCVLQTGVDKKAYQYSLLVMGRRLSKYPEVANGFNFNSLKKRIAMMNTGSSSRLQLSKYVVVIPAITVSVLIFTATSAYEHATDTFKVSAVQDGVKEEPLYIIDGKEGSPEEMRKLAPDDIQAINVWKGESSLQKYGAKGKNGVVEIATKKGGESGN
jgi:Antirepressor regulating drug resistance, predicted signal transduction N-terminal membrane component